MYYNIIGYARVSTQEQAEDSNALKQQVALLQEHGADIVVSEVISRMSDNRTGLDYILDLIDNKKFKVLLIKDLSRLTGLSGLFEYLTDKLRTNGIELRGVYDAIDIYSTMGQTMSAIQVVINKAEVLRIRERINRGIQYRRSKHFANPNPPFGYRVIDNKYVLDNNIFLSLIDNKQLMTKEDISRWIIEQFFIHKSISKTVDTIHKTYGLYRFKYVKDNENNSETFSIHSIDSIKVEHKKKSRGRPYNPFYFNTQGLSQWLTNPILCGHTRYNTRKGNKRLDESEHIIVYNTHPNQVLLTDNEQLEIKDIINNNKPNSGWLSYHRKKHKPHYLTGLLVCKNCNNNFYIIGTNSMGNCYYHCSNRLTCNNNGKGKGLREDIVNNYVIKQLINKALEITNSIDSTLNLSNNNELYELEQQLLSLSKLPYNPAIEIAKLDINKQIDKVKNSISSINQQYNVNRTMLLESIKDSNYWYGLDNMDRLYIYHLLINKILVSNSYTNNLNERLTIIWNNI